MPRMPRRRSATRTPRARCENLDDSIAWTERGDNALTGIHDEGADVLTFNDAGKLVTFEALGDTAQMDRVFAR